MTLDEAGYAPCDVCHGEFPEYELVDGVCWLDRITEDGDG